MQTYPGPSKVDTYNYIGLFIKAQSSKDIICSYLRHQLAFVSCPAYYSNHWNMHMKPYVELFIRALFYKDQYVHILK